MDWFVFISEQWILVSLLGALVIALVWVETNKGGRALNFHEVTRMINAEQAVLVDVRDAKEYKTGHIVGALSVPHSKLADYLDSLEKYRQKTLIVVDKMGQHGGAVGKQLREKGFIVARMQGGMAEWLGQNLPVTQE